MKAIIMAGGFGTRLAPLTRDLPKPLVPIIDKPILYYIIRLLYKYNIKQIGITLNYLSEKIINEFSDGSSLGVKLTYFIEKSPLGTAGSVKNASDFLLDKNDTDNDFIIISGDAFTDFKLNKLIAFHRSNGGLISLASYKVDNPSNFGVLKADKTGLIEQFFEKPEKPVSNLVNTGIYVMQKEVLKYIKQGFQDFAKDVFPTLLGRIYAKKMNGFWSDIGTLPQYYETNKYVSLNLSKYAELF